MVLEDLFAPRQKAETGVGASMIRHGIPLTNLNDSPQKRAQTALAAYRANIHIRGSERTIANQIADVPWWLQDAEGARVTDESPEEMRGIKALLERPYRPDPGDPVTASPQTFTGLSQITIRHMGLVGYGFWYLVGVEGFGLPIEILYINPARMVPSLDKAGNLLGWVLDPDATGKGTPFTTDEIVPFYLEEPDMGFLTDGLVHTALAKAELGRMADQHIASILATGGRIPGIFHPPSGESIPEEAYQGLVRDMRTILEDPNAAKRTMVLKGPLEFTPTSMSPSDINILEMQAMSRDDIAGLWGVPISQRGYQRPVGIGELSEDKDAQMMWNNAIAPRLGGFAETLQRRVIDLFESGLDVVFDIPEFDDKATLFDMAQKAATVPMRNVERRDIVSLPPFGDPALDNAVVLPINLVEVSQAPEFDPGESRALKARLEKDPAVVRLKDALTSFLTDQAERIGGKIEKRAGHITRKPNDETVWWNEKEEDAALFDAIRPHLLPFAEAGATSAIQKVTGKATLDELAGGVFTESLLAATLRRLGFRVTGINRTTRDRIRALILAGLDADLSASEVGRSLRGEVTPLQERIDPETGRTLPADTVGNKLRERLGDFGSELRAETIARTEMRVAQNGAALDSYQVEGVQSVEMLDGDQDDVCKERDGQVVSLEQAESHMAAEHPNGTLDFAPVVNFDGKADNFVAYSPAENERNLVQPITPVTVNYPPPEMKVEVNIPDIHVPATEVHVPKPDPVHVEVTTPAPVVEIQPAPAVTVEASAPVVVPAPEVTIEAPREKASGAPQLVHVTNMPPPRTAKVKRDPRTNQITEVVQE